MADKQVFMNLQNDYAFKRVFGSLKHKNVLIRFLNILLEEDGIKVHDISLHDKEVLPSSEKGKRIIYDVYCTTYDNDSKEDENEHIIIEMQNSYHPLFEKRSVYYFSRAVAEQGMKGGDYNFKPVYLICVTNFYFRHMAKSARHDIRLIDRCTGDIFTDSIAMIFVPLVEAKKNWEDCTTEYEKLVFIIKNMKKMTKESKAYRSGEFDDLFEASDMGSMTNEEMVAYSQSELKLKENQAVLEYAAKESYKQGIEQGIEQGLMQGREQEKFDIARKLKSNGISDEMINLATGLSIQEISQL